MTRAPDTLPNMLRQSAQRFADHPVFIQQDRVTTYGELAEAAERFAAGLAARGLGRGDRVVLALGNSMAYLVAYYGVSMAGCVVVPHYPDTRAHLIEHVVSHSGARAVVLEGRALRHLAGPVLEGKVPDLELVVEVGPAKLPAPIPLERVALHELVTGGAGAAPDEPTAGDLAAIVYTSGTTGRPKGVMLGHDNLLANVESIVTYLELTAEDRIAMVLPFFYVYGNSVLHTHVRVGGTVVDVGTMAFPAAVLSGIRRHRCTGLSGVPSTFARLIQLKNLEKHDLSSLRYLTQAGGPMTPALTTKLRALLPDAAVFVMYGQTEASARLSYLPPADLERKLGSAGVAIPGVTLTIVDADGAEVPRGQPGEILARGKNIMRGYWNNEEETARVLGPGGLRTGDLATMDEEGYIFIIGRQSDMIKSGAHRIGPQEIEDVVEKLPGVSECAVVGVPDDILGEAIAAFVVLMPGVEVTEREVLRACHEHLPRFKLPAHVRFVDGLPHTATGKVRRKELKTWFADGQGNRVLPLRDDVGSNGRPAPRRT